MSAPAMPRMDLADDAFDIDLDFIQLEPRSAMPLRAGTTDSCPSKCNTCYITCGSSTVLIRTCGC